jgi:hypothetical protein
VAEIPRFFGVWASVFREVSDSDSVGFGARCPRFGQHNTGVAAADRFGRFKEMLAEARFHAVPGADRRHDNVLDDASAITMRNAAA